MPGYKTFIVNKGSYMGKQELLVNTKENLCGDAVLGNLKVGSL